MQVYINEYKVITIIDYIQFLTQQSLDFLLDKWKLDWRFLSNASQCLDA